MRSPHPNFSKSIKAGTAFALSLNFVQLLEENYENPNFPTKHLLKDTNLFLQKAVKIGLNATSLEGVKAILEATQKLGKSDDDYSALFTTIKP